MDMVLVAFLLTFLPIHGLILCGILRKQADLKEQQARALTLLSIARGGRSRRRHL